MYGAAGGGEWMRGEPGTQEKILFFGKREFLQKGYQNASLRSIASAAGLTTGAIYAYFKDKNALFEAIVAPVCAQVEGMFRDLSAAYYTDEGVVSELSTEKTVADLRRIYDFIYGNFDSFRLLVAGAECSARDGYVHTLVDYEVEHTLAYVERMMKGKTINVALSRAMIHLVSESYINAILEPVRHNMRYEEAIENLDFLCAFYTGGWKSVFQELFHG